MRGTQVKPDEDLAPFDPADDRLDENLVERALTDLDDDVARTGILCSENDLNRAADRHALSILEIGELRRRATEQMLTEATDPSASPPRIETRRSSDASTNDPLRWLFEHLQDFPPLDAAGEVALARSIENGRRAEEALGKSPALPHPQELELAAEKGQEAKKRMVACNIRLAIANAKDFRGGGLDFDDLVQAAMPGLIRAAEKFDHRKGFKFSTYATWWIRQSISRALADTGRTIRLPVHVVERLRKFRAARSKLESRLGREPTPEELAAHLDWELAEVVALTESIPTVISLDAPVGRDADSPALAELIASDTPSPLEQTIDTVRVELLHHLLDELSPRQQEVLELRHGLNGVAPLTLEEVGRKFGITRERVRQIERGAIKALRRRGEEEGLEG